MKMKTVLFGAFIVMLLATGYSAVQSDQEIDSSAAFEMLSESDTYLIDVRTIAEYVYVGHPETAYSIPFLFWDEQNIQQVPNTRFIEDVKRRYKTDDALILICRSGNRSVQAALALRQEGFRNVFNVTDGFEGQRDPNGLRTVDGWKNRGLPYTYSLNPNLMYKSQIQ